MDTNIQTYINNIRHHLSLKGQEPPTKIMQAIAQELDAIAEAQYLEAKTTTLTSAASPNYNIDTLQAGPELDKLVAAKVMGWRLVPDGFGRQHEWFDSNGKRTGYRTWDKPFRPSTNLSAVWMVLERAAYWQIEKGATWVTAEIAMPGTKVVSADADTAPLAICRAALKALLMAMD